LNSDKKERKREAVKKTIANMTVGKVNILFIYCFPVICGS
jgi:vesicle coat complex subunit